MKMEMMGLKMKEGMLLSFVVLGSISFLFLVIPVVNVFLNTPLDEILKAILDESVQNSIMLSFYTAALTTVFAFLFGTPLAYILARKNFPLKGLVDSFIDIPILLPHTVAGIALLTVFGGSGFLGEIFSYLGVKFVDTILGILVAQVFVSIPFYIKTVRESFEKIDYRYYKVARTLGATPFRAFFEVEFPLSFHSMVSGAILCWARALSEFGAVIVLSYHPPIAPVLIYQRFVLQGLKATLPITSLLIILTVVIFLIMRKIQYGMEGKLS